MSFCGTCRFIDKTDEKKPFCRRYPAQLVNQQTMPGVIALAALFPVVDPKQDWCGEYDEEEMLDA